MTINFRSSCVHICSTEVTAPAVETPTVVTVVVWTCWRYCLEVMNDGQVIGQAWRPHSCDILEVNIMGKLRMRLGGNCEALQAKIGMAGKLVTWRRRILQMYIYECATRNRVSMMFHCHLGLVEGNGYNRADCFWGQCQCLTMISLKAGELSNDVVGTVGNDMGSGIMYFPCNFLLEMGKRRAPESSKSNKKSWCWWFQLQAFFD